MSLRHRARAGVLALGVLGSSLIAGTAGATVHPASCGLELLGSPVQVKLLNGTQVALFYLGYNTCNGDVYSEVHFSTSLTIVQNGYNYVSVINGVGNGGTDWAPPSSTTSSTYWTSPMEWNYLNSSQTRTWHGMTEFNFYLGSTSHSCSAFTPTWNFSNGSVVSGGGMECDQS